MDTTQWIASATGLGLGATFFMDLVALLRRRLFNVPSLDYRFVGRWLGHMPSGRFRHASISRAQPVRHERLTGWLFHYLTGVAFAAVLLAGAGERRRALALSANAGAGTAGGRTQCCSTVADHAAGAGDGGCRLKHAASTTGATQEPGHAPLVRHWIVCNGLAMGSVTGDSPQLIQPRGVTLAHQIPAHAPVRMGRYACRTQCSPAPAVVDLVQHGHHP